MRTAPKEVRKISRPASAYSRKRGGRCGMMSAPLAMRRPTPSNARSNLHVHQTTSATRATSGPQHPGPCLLLAQDRNTRGVHTATWCQDRMHPHAVLSV